MLETPISTLIGETVAEQKADKLKAISAKLEIINLQLAKMNNTRRKAFHWCFVSVCALIAVIGLVLFLMSSPYLNWDYNDPEWAVIGAAFHAFEWLFVRTAPIVFFGAFAGVILTRKRQSQYSFDGYAMI